MIGVAVVWLIVQFHPFPTLSLFAEKDTTGRIIRYKVFLEAKHILWFSVLVETVVGYLFLSLYEFNKSADIKDITTIGLVQGFLYLLFFIILISIFATLVNLTKQKYDYEFARDSFAQTVYETLVKTRHVQPGIQIYQNQVLTPEKAINLRVPPNYFMAREMTVKTISQDEVKLKFIISNDGKEIIKFTHTPELPEED